MGLFDGAPSGECGGGAGFVLEERDLSAGGVHIPVCSGFCSQASTIPVCSPQGPEQEGNGIAGHRPHPGLSGILLASEHYPGLLAAGPEQEGNGIAGHRPAVCSLFLGSLES